MEELTKRKWQNLSIFKKYFSTPFCKKGLGQPAKPLLMSGFKDGGGVIVQGHLQFTDITFMCMPAMIPMMKRGNERELFRNTNFCIQFMWKKAALSLR